MTLKGQSAVEFIMLVSMSLFLLLSLVTISTQHQEQLQIHSSLVEAQKVAQDISFQAEMALVQGDYYHREFVVPNRIGSQNYTLYIVPSTVVVELERDGNVTMPSLYAGNTISHQVETDQNDLKIVHNDTGIHLHEQ